MQEHTYYTELLLLSAVTTEFCNGCFLQKSVNLWIVIRELLLSAMHCERNRLPDERWRLAPVMTTEPCPTSMCTAVPPSSNLMGNLSVGYLTRLKACSQGFRLLLKSLIIHADCSQTKYCTMFTYAVNIIWKTLVWRHAIKLCSILCNEPIVSGNKNRDKCLYFSSELYCFNSEAITLPTIKRCKWCGNL
jgi:hypothetical protein